MSTATKLVRSVRDRIDAVVSAERRREILVNLGCFRVPPTTRGVEMLAAIEALDVACLRGSDEEIEATGARLIALWAQANSVGRAAQ
jgi:hypothetical protein